VEVFRKMDLTQYVSNEYLIAAFSGIVFYLGAVYIFLDRFEAKLKSKQDKHDEEVESKYVGTRATIRSIIQIFDSLKKNRDEIEKKTRMIELMHWIGVAYIIAAFVGFIFQQTGISQDIPIAMMAATALYFVVFLILVIFWDRKLKFT